MYVVIEFEAVADALHFREIVFGEDFKLSIAGFFVVFEGCFEGLGKGLKEFGFGCGAVVVCGELGKLRVEVALIVMREEAGEVFVCFKIFVGGAAVYGVFAVGEMGFLLDIVEEGVGGFSSLGSVAFGDAVEITNFVSEGGKSVGLFSGSCRGWGGSGCVGVFSVFI